MSLAIKELDSSQRAELVELFLEIFTGAPWYDVWEDPDRPALYLEELTGSPNSLSLGLYDGSRLIGISLGRILHFAFGTQYCIDEFGIRPDRQGQGAGREFLRQIENFARARKIDFLFLMTDRGFPSESFYRKNGFRELERNICLFKKL